MATQKPIVAKPPYAWRGRLFASLVDFIERRQLEDPPSTEAIPEKPAHATGRPASEFIARGPELSA